MAWQVCWPATRRGSGPDRASGITGVCSHGSYKQPPLATIGLSCMSPMDRTAWWIWRSELLAAEECFVHSKPPASFGRLPWTPKPVQLCGPTASISARMYCTAWRPASLFQLLHWYADHKTDYSASRDRDERLEEPVSVRANCAVNVVEVALSARWETRHCARKLVRK